MLIGESVVQRLIDELRHDLIEAHGGIRPPLSSIQQEISGDGDSSDESCSEEDTVDESMMTSCSAGTMEQRANVNDIIPNLDGLHAITLASNDHYIDVAPVDMSGATKMQPSALNLFHLYFNKLENLTFALIRFMQSH